MQPQFRSAIAVPALFLILSGCSNAPIFERWSRSDRAKPIRSTQKSPRSAKDNGQESAAQQQESVAALDPDTQQRIEQYLERFPDNELAQKLARPSEPPPLKKNNPKAPPTRATQSPVEQSTDPQPVTVAKSEDAGASAETKPEIETPAEPEPVAVVKMDTDLIPEAKVEPDSPQQAEIAAPAPSPTVGSNKPMEIKEPDPAEVAPPSTQKPVVKKVGIVQPAEIAPPAEPPTPKTNNPVVADAPGRELTLDDLITGLEKKLAEAPNDIDTQFKLRFLYAATDKDDKAAELTPGMDQDMSEFLQRMFVAIDDAKTAAKDPVTGADRALDSLNNLRQVVRRYAQLQIPKLEFCRKVDSYGVYEAHSPPVFFAQQGNRVIVYCEVKNFASDKTPDGLFKTQLAQRMEILTPNSHSEWKMEDENIVDVSRNRREDFFIIQIIDLPNSLAAGNYVLKVSVVDKLSNRTQEEFLEFTMQGATAQSSGSNAGQAFAGKPEE